AEELASGTGRLFEPKSDRFRAIAFKACDHIYPQSRDLPPFDRYFPDLWLAFAAHFPERCVVDGEIVIVGSGGLDFDLLQLRLHPAASRVAKLAAASPASFAAFDLLPLGGRDLRETPFSSRRAL